MIIKSLSRSTTSGISSLVRYIFREQKLTVKRYNHFVDFLVTKQNEHKAVYVAGVKLNNADIKYLLADAQDSKLLAELKEFKGSVKDFIQQRLITQHPEIVKESKPFMITHNLRSLSVNGFIKELEKNEANRVFQRANQNTIHHTILSWANTDTRKITDAMLRDMAREYIKQRGENNVYCITKHEDREHTHLHVAMGATQLNGLSSRISKKEFGEIKLAMDLYQKEHFPQLVHSLPEHGKGQQNKEAEKNYKRNERTNILNTTLRCLVEIQEKSTSTSHFIQQLNDRAIEVYERGNKPTGVVCDGYKFRFNKLGIDFEKLKSLDVKQEEEKKQLDEMANLRNRGKDKNIEKVTNIDIPVSPCNEGFKNPEEKALQELAEIRDSKNDRGTDRDNDNDSGRDISEDTFGDSDDLDDKDNESEDSNNVADADDEGTKMDDPDDSNEAEY